MSPTSLFAIRMGCLMTLDKTYAEGYGSDTDKARALQIFQSFTRRISESPVVQAKPIGDTPKEPMWLPVADLSGSEMKRTALRFDTAIQFNVHWPSVVSHQWVYNTSAPDVALGLPPLPMGED